MSTLPQVREHLKRQAEAHRHSHQEALRLAAIARADAEAAALPDVPQPGLQSPPEGFWEGDGD